MRIPIKLATASVSALLILLPASAATAAPASADRPHPVRASGPSPRHGVAAPTSYDVGRTWRNTTQLIADTELAFFNDKNSVTADAVRPGRAYQVWDRLQFSPDGNSFITGPTFLSDTRDGGRT